MSPRTLTLASMLFLDLLLLPPFSISHLPWHFCFCSLEPFFLLRQVILKLQINENIWYLSLSVWLASFNIRSFSFFQVAENCMLSSFLMVTWYFIVYLEHNLIFHFLSLDTWIVLFPSCAMNIGVQVAFQVILRLRNRTLSNEMPAR